MAKKQTPLTADNRLVLGATYRDPATDTDYTSKTHLGAIPRFLQEAMAAGVPVSKFMVKQKATPGAAFKLVLGATYRDPATGKEFTKGQLGAIPKGLKEAIDAGEPASKFMVKPKQKAAPTVVKRRTTKAESERFDIFMVDLKFNLLSSLDLLRAQLLLQSDIQLTKPILDEMDDVQAFSKLYLKRDIETFRAMERELGVFKPGAFFGS